MQKEIPLKNRFLDRSLLIIAAVICAVFSWAFLNVTGEYASIFLIFAFLWCWWNDRKIIKRLREENSEKAAKIKALRTENTTLKKTAAIKHHLIDKS